MYTPFWYNQLDILYKESKIESKTLEKEEFQRVKNRLYN